MIADNQQGQALSYVVGVYFGDGCVTHRKMNADGTENRCFSLSVIDRDFRDYTAQQAALAFPDTTIYPFDTYREGKGHIYMLRVERIGHYLERITGKRSLIPNFVHEEANVRPFLEGLLDSEGWVTDTTYLRKDQVVCVVGFAITSELAYEFKVMLEGIGVKVGKVGTKKLPSGRIAKQMHFNTASFLDSGLSFHCWRKQRKIEGHRWARKVLLEATASKLPDGVSFNDYKQSVRRRCIEALQAIV